MKAITLKENPQIKVNVDGTERVYSLGRVDMTDGYLESQRLMQKCITEMAKMKEDKHDISELIKTMRRWFIFVLGEKSYNEIFSTPARRENYQWHESLFIGAALAISECRAGIIGEAANSPMVQQLKEQLMEQIKQTANGD